MTSSSRVALDTLVSHGSRHVLKEIGLLIFAILAIMQGPVLMEYVMEDNWLGAILALFFVGGMAVAVHSIRNRGDGAGLLRQMLFACAYAAALGIAAFSGISFVLSMLGWPLFPDTVEPEMARIFRLYVWHLADVIPGLGASKILGPAEVSSLGFVQATPILLFRAAIVFGLIAAIREWWKRAPKASEAT